jgi:hypothetical protein
MLLFVRQSARRPINKFGIKGWELPAPQHTILTTDLILFPMFFCILILVYHVFCYQKRIPSQGLNSSLSDLFRPLYPALR